MKTSKHERNMPGLFLGIDSFTVEASGYFLLRNLCIQYSYSCIYLLSFMLTVPIFNYDSAEAILSTE